MCGWRQRGLQRSRLPLLAVLQRRGAGLLQRRLLRRLSSSAPRQRQRRGGERTSSSVLRWQLLKRRGSKKSLRVPPPPQQRQHGSRPSGALLLLQRPSGAAWQRRRSARRPRPRRDAKQSCGGNGGCQGLAAGGEAGLRLPCRVPATHARTMHPHCHALREAEEAERRRRAAEERQRLEELRRVEVSEGVPGRGVGGRWWACVDADLLPSLAPPSTSQEEQRARREAKRRAAVQRLYFARWLAEARRRKAERARQARIAAHLKACRVGAAGKVRQRWRSSWIRMCGEALSCGRSHSHPTHPPTHPATHADCAGGRSSSGGRCRGV